MPINPAPFVEPRGKSYVRVRLTTTRSLPPSSTNAIVQLPGAGPNG
jgi:hypothetical protein